MSWILSAFADEASESIDEQIRALTEAQLTHIDLRSVDGVNICELEFDDWVKAERARRLLVNRSAAGLTRP